MKRDAWVDAYQIFGETMCLSRITFHAPRLSLNAGNRHGAGGGVGDEAQLDLESPAAASVAYAQVSRVGELPLDDGRELEQLGCRVAEAHVAAAAHFIRRERAVCA